MFDDMHKGSGCLKCPVDEFGCDAQYRGSRCAALRAKVGADFEPKTNADRIRAMSDEQLANLLTDFSNNAGWVTEIGRQICYEQYQRWLQQPAED